MAMHAFNMLRASSALREGGHFNEDQAKAIVEAVHIAISEGVATQSELNRVEAVLTTRIDATEARLDAKIDSNFREQNTKIDALDTKIDSNFRELSAEIRSGQNKLMASLIAFMILLMGVTLTAIKLFFF